MAKTSNVLYPIYVREKSPSNDAKFGPYASKEQAIYELNKMNALTEGLEIGIKVDGVTTRYYFKGGVGIEHLVQADLAGNEEFERLNGEAIVGGYCDADSGEADLMLKRRNGQEIPITIPAANKTTAGLMNPDHIRDIEKALSNSASANGAASAANIAAEKAKKAAEDASKTTTEIKDTLNSLGSIDNPGLITAENVVAKVADNASRIARLELLTSGGMASGSASLPNGDFSAALQIAKDYNEPFVFLLDDTINGVAIKKPIYHIGDRQFIDAIGAPVYKSMAKPVVTLTPEGGEYEMPLTVNASCDVEGADIYMNGQMRTTMQITEGATVEAYAVNNDVVGDTVTATYTEVIHEFVSYDNGVYAEGASLVSTDRCTDNVTYFKFKDGTAPHLLIDTGFVAEEGKIYTTFAELRNTVDSTRYGNIVGIKYDAGNGWIDAVTGPTNVARMTKTKNGTYIVKSTDCRINNDPAVATIPAGAKIGVVVYSYYTLTEILKVGLSYE